MESKTTTALYGEYLGAEHRESDGTPARLEVFVKTQNGRQTLFQGDPKALHTNLKTVEAELKETIYWLESIFAVEEE